MKLIKINISCCRNDLYFLRICVASIRYWNTTVPVYLLKDFSKGDFDTAELEKVFNVGVVDTKYRNLQAYIKLQPFIENNNERIFLQDADVVWLGDIIEELKDYTEDIVIHSYKPADLEKEINKRYFKMERMTKFYPYNYPGFVFNTGAMLFNTTILDSKDFDGIIRWQENALPLHDNVFLCEDQGILNFLIGNKILDKKISYASKDLQLWGFAKEVDQYDIAQIMEKKGITKVIHWYGEKPGFTSLMPGRHILDFYEKHYYSQLERGSLKLVAERFRRTFPRIGMYVYEGIKKLYYRLNSRKQYEHTPR
ncbi:MAG TPA: hypothetical protein VK498_05785 [Ferruginibacter sp.]|nr:hypothetical protein [Ferruginibacter sp.]